MKTLILASQSPRRFEILKKENYFFVPFPVYVSEIPDKNLSLNEQIIEIARRKAKACLDLYPAQNNNLVILSADTMVCIEDQAIGKPLNDLDAKNILEKLSGRNHQVKTALYLIDVDTRRELSHIETTEVYFKKLSLNDIQNYLATGEHRDKAGAYGIQGQGKILVEKYEGDYNNIVGLPLDALKNIFLKQNWDMQRASGN